MNEEIDETEFYQDFTTASEWEIFIAGLEEIINQWKTEDLKNDSEEVATSISPIWHITNDTLSFVDFEFTLSLYRRNVNQKPQGENPENPQKNPFDSYHDFELFDPKAQLDHSCLAKWYGIDEYIVLSPSANNGITSESRIKILLSSVYVVTASLKIDLPFFVQIREKWQHCYMGVYENESIRTNLEMVHLRSCPRLCQYLSGLLELFKSKIVTSTMTSTILVSLQSSYALTDFGTFTWKQDYLNPDSDHFDTSGLCALSFGVTIDPIESIVLKATWSHLNHRAVRDNESYSDFNPITAPQWSVMITVADQPLCLLGECLGEFLNFLNNTNTVYDVLGDFAASPSSTEVINHPLDLLTEPKLPTITSLLTRAARNSLSKIPRKGSAPLSEDILVPMLYFLFPDADEESPYTYKDNESKIQLVSFFKPIILTIMVQ